MATRPIKPFSLKTQPGFTTIAMFCFALLYLPIVTLVVYAFNAGASVAVWEGFSFRWFVSAWHNEDIQEAALRTLGIAPDVPLVVAQSPKSPAAKAKL